MYLVPGDLPTTVLSSMPILAGQRQAGIDVVAATKVSGRDEQAAYTPKVQLVRDTGANMVYNGSNDVAMVKMRQEAAAQGLSGRRRLGVHDRLLHRRLQGGGHRGGRHLRGDEPSSRSRRRITTLSWRTTSTTCRRPSSWGANGWQSAVLFKTVIDQIVATDGPNAITRAKMLEVLGSMGPFDANGWMAPLPLRGVSSCGVVMQIENGEFHRVYPEEPGTLTCHPEFVETITIDPNAAAAALG